MHWHWLLTVQAVPTEAVVFGLLGILGGVAHLVFRTGRVVQRIDELSRRMDRVEGILDGRIQPEGAILPPKRRR